MDNDSETQQALQEAQALQGMFASSGWAVAQKALDDLVAALSDVTSLDPTGADIAQQVRDRINLVAALKSWRDDLTGRVHNLQHLQGAGNKDRLIERQ